MANNPLRAASLLLVLEIATLYGTATRLPRTLDHPLKKVPVALKNWYMTDESDPGSEVMELLKADDVLNRTYTSLATNQIAGLFAAYFRTPKAGITPHSPKICLPSDGWRSLQSDVIPARVTGYAAPVQLNRMVISRDGEQMLIVYWYETFSHTVADEFALKFYMVLDSLRYRRSETTMVRIAVPIVNGNQPAAEQSAMSFLDASFGEVSKALPRMWPGDIGRP